jgi:predicted DNA-binding protein (MmcQ/YjbR family)
MDPFKAAEEALMEAALAYPETHEDNPWGHRVAKVKGKAFLFLGGDKDQGTFSLSVKLPNSGGMALSLPFAEPTGYGLGKSGWVSASFRAGQDVPVGMLRAWLDESFQAVAPKRLVKAYLESRGAVGTETAPAPARKAVPSTPAKKRAKVAAPMKKAATKAVGKQTSAKAARAPARKAVAKARSARA